MAMKIKDDGNIVRGLGCVTLESAYLEETIDDLLCLLSQVDGESCEKWPISRKIKHSKKILLKLDFDSRDDIIKDLSTCIELFEGRNEIVHGRIYGNLDPENRFDTLKSGRSNAPDRNICSSELYKLANEFANFRPAIMAPMRSEIPTAINEYLEKKE